MLCLSAVAVPVPNLDLLTYAVADGVDRPAIGRARARAAGHSRRHGYCHRPRRRSWGRARSKLVQKVLDAHAFVPAEVVGLARWTAEYYAAGVGDTIPALLPPMARGGRVDAHKTQRIASITPSGLEALQLAWRPSNARRSSCSPRHADGIPTPTLTARRIAGSAITRLVRHGYISVRTERLARDPFALRSGSDPDQIGIEIRIRSGSDPAGLRRLTGEQQAAFDRLRALADSRAFHVALLHGVTGSGKTEIYLRLATTTRDAGRRVLMLGA